MMQRSEKSRPEAVVRGLFRYPVRGGIPVEEGSLTLLEEKGIQGDCHADGSDRQISLLTETEKIWMEQQPVKGHCFRKYKENILLGGISLRELSPGDCLQIGSAVLLVAADKKSCHRELCPLAASRETCILAGCCSFAAVKKGGAIHKGDTGRILAVRLPGLYPGL